MKTIYEYPEISECCIEFSGFLCQSVTQQNAVEIDELSSLYGDGDTPESGNLIFE